MNSCLPFKIQNFGSRMETELELDLKLKLILDPKVMDSKLILNPKILFSKLSLDPDDEDNVDSKHTALKSKTDPESDSRKIEIDKKSTADQNLVAKLEPMAKAELKSGNKLEQTLKLMSKIKMISKAESDLKAEPKPTVKIQPKKIINLQSAEIAELLATKIESEFKPEQEPKPKELDASKNKEELQSTLKPKIELVPTVDVNPTTVESGSKLEFEPNPEFKTKSKSEPSSELDRKIELEPQPEFELKPEFEQETEFKPKALDPKNKFEPKIETDSKFDESKTVCNEEGGSIPNYSALEAKIEIINHETELEPQLEQELEPKVESRVETKLPRKEFGDQLYTFLLQNPKRCDVLFSVGPSKTPIGTMRAILVISSPVFKELFEDSWDHITAKQNKPIPLPHFHPDAFQVLIQLLVKDDVTVLTLQKMNLTAEIILNLTEICEEYCMENLSNILATLLEKTIFNDLQNFTQSQEYFDMSSKNVKKILTREELRNNSNCDIFDMAWKWCELECERQGELTTDENIKATLERCLSDVPLATGRPIDSEDVEIELEKSLLTYDNIMAAMRGEPPEEFEFLTFEENQLIEYMKEIHWETRRASLIYGPTLSFLNRFQLSNEPYEGHEQMCTLFFQTDQSINLTSVGFLGPIVEDFFCEIWVEILRFLPYYMCYTCGEVWKKLYVRKQTIFHVEFDEPIPISPTFTEEMNWANYYGVRFTIKGTDIQTMNLGISHWEGDKPADRTFWFEESNVRFYCEMSNNPLVTLSFRRPSESEEITNSDEDAPLN